MLGGPLNRAVVPLVPNRSRTTVPKGPSPIRVRAPAPLQAESRRPERMTAWTHPQATGRPHGLVGGCVNSSGMEPDCTTGDQRNCMVSLRKV